MRFLVCFCALCVEKEAEEPIKTGTESQWVILMRTCAQSGGSGRRGNRERRRSSKPRDDRTSRRA